MSGRSRKSGDGRDYHELEVVGTKMDRIENIEKRVCYSLRYCHLIKRVLGNSFDRKRAPFTKSKRLPFTPCNARRKSKFHNAPPSC